jgi:hypothetical protein
MRYVEAPLRYTPKKWETSVFIAGGITGTERWQHRAVELLSDLEVVVFNPRRQHFPIDDDLAHEHQVQWEHRYLHDETHRVDTVLFWFPASSTPAVQQPIALFELGRLIERGTPIAVGASKHYLRRRDVVAQVKARPELTVKSTLEDTVADIRLLIKPPTKPRKHPVSGKSDGDPRRRVIP